jgi:phospholipid/cholesterol/gamma-HCH transport system ATP-binding protein
MGYLFQSGALLNWMTIGENVELPLREHRRRMSAAEREEKVREKLDLDEMEPARHKYPAEVSGGMKKRAALARAIVLEPEIILYDEPTSGLDPVIANTINDLIVHTREVLGATQIVVTHDMESAYRIADRIAMLYEGKIIEAGSVEEIRSSKNPVVQQFITGNTKGPLSKEE